MKKILLGTLMFVFAPFLMQAQYVDQSILISQNRYGGTSRSEAMGNAFGALGADMSSFAINPAGLGLYRNSEFSFTPNVMSLSKVKSSWYGNENEDSKYKFNISNAGYLGVGHSAKGSALVSFSFGVAYNRVKDFNTDEYTRAENLDFSRTEVFENKANADYNNNPNFKVGEDFANAETQLAYDTYLINPNGNIDRNPYDATYDYAAGDYTMQYNRVSRRGRIDEYLVGFGLNFINKLYFGASVVFQDVTYREYVDYGEDLFAPLNNNMSDNYGVYNYRQTTYLDGRGFGLKMGLIYKPIQNLHLGFACQIPTFYDIHESYQANMAANGFFSVDENGNFQETTEDQTAPINDFDYDIKSPWRFTFSGAYIFKQKGILSFDYQLEDYTKMDLRNAGDGIPFDMENAQIKQRFNKAHNFRVGAEYLATKSLSLRVGYQYWDDPDVKNLDQVGIDLNKTNIYSGGFGYRFKNMYVDMAYSCAHEKSEKYMYQIFNLQGKGVVAPVEYTQLDHRLKMTFGFRF